MEIQDWSVDDRRAFRAASLAAWDEFAESDAARNLIKMHKDFQSRIGLTDER